jgi:hypothetical protein
MGLVSSKKIFKTWGYEWYKNSWKSD